MLSTQNKQDKQDIKWQLNLILNLKCYYQVGG